MYAIIVTGGKQYKVEVGSEIMVEKLDEQIGANVNFDVLMMADGENVQIGTPVVKGVRCCSDYCVSLLTLAIRN